MNTKIHSTGANDRQVAISSVEFFEAMDRLSEARHLARCAMRLGSQENEDSDRESLWALGVFVGEHLDGVYMRFKLLIDEAMAKGGAE